MERYIKQLDVRRIQNALQKGTQVDADLDGKGRTALHFAAALTDEADCITVAEVLLSNGANPNIQNNYGQSSLHVAASYGYSRLLELLLVNGGDPLLCDIMSYSPIDYAFEKKQMEIVEQLNKFLDMENYECSQESRKKFVLSFWRQEVVEVPVLSQEGSEVSYLSEGGRKDHGKLEKDTRNQSPKCSISDSYLEESFTTRYSQFLRDLENYDHHKIDTDEDTCPSLPILPEEKSVEKNRSHLQYPDFLKKLKQTIHASRDSDSDSEMISLQRCLEQNLHEDSSRSCNSFMSRNTNTAEQTLNELDVAQLNISVMDETFGSLHDVFDATYIPPYKQQGVFNNFRSSNLKGESYMSNDGCITLNSFTEDESTFIDDTEDGSTLADSIFVVAEKNLNNLEQNKAIQKSASKHNAFQEYPVNVSAPRTIYRPEECQSVNMIKAPRKVCRASNPPLNRPAKLFEGTLEKGTAPHAIFKPEECRTINMLKAPRKAVPYVERCNADNPLRNPPSKLFEEQDGTYNPKKNADGTIILPGSYTLKKINQMRSIPGTPRSQKGFLGTKTPSDCSSCQSYFSVVEEFIYEDPEAGVTLIERRCPTSSSVGSLTRTGSQMGSLPRSLTQSKRIPDIQQTKKGNVAFEETLDSIGTVTNSIKALPADALRARLKELGCSPGPIMPGTQRVYQRHLMRLRKNPQMLQNDAEDSKPKYSREMKAALEDPSAIDWMSWASLEAVMSAPFTRPDPLRHWRDGTTKSCFNYLLLDPRVTEDLPVRGLMMSEAEKLQCFISAIFYIGKGSRGRPYYHLYEAIKSMENGKKKNKKIEKIHDIWSDGVGVVSLHVFQNTIPVEAWTREAAMINAIGLGNLCNSIQGTFYGLPSTWRWAERRRLGTHLLWRALHIFLQEGERQLRPSDVTLPTWMK